MALALILCGSTNGFLLDARAQGSAENVVWEHLVNTSATGNSLQKTGGQGDAGANSQQQLTSSGGYVEFGVSMNHRMQVGLSNDASDAVDYTQLKYTFNFWGDYFDIREGWENYYGWWPYQSGDVFRITVEGDVVKYYQNGTLLRTSTRAPSYPLVLDTALTATGATVQNAVLSATAGVKTDRGIYREPALPTLPAAGGKFFDPTFGTQIMRVTDANDGTSNGTWYSVWPTFNCDNTRLLARTNGGSTNAVYDFDPQTFTLGTKTVIPATPDSLAFLAESATWSSTDPDILYGVGFYGSPQKLWAYNAETQTYTLVRDFSSALSSGQYLWQMSMSDDDDTFAFTIKSQSGTAQVGYIVYKKSTNQILLNVSDTTINEVSLDKTGRYLIVPLDFTDANGHDVLIRDLQTSTVEGLAPGAPDHPMGHGDYGAGISVAWDRDTNRFLRRSLATPHQWTVALAPGSYWQNSHLSMRAADDDWSLVSFYDSYSPLPGGGLFQRELVLVKNDGTKFRRLAHHRSIFETSLNQQNRYWDIPRANISRDGRYVAFSSNWGGSSRQDLFIARIQPGATAVPDTNEPAPEPSQLSQPWSHADIGTVGVAGAAVQQSGTFAVYGAGTQIWGGADSFHFVYQPISGDKDIVARVTSLDFGSPGANVGVMMREQLAEGSRNAYVGINRQLDAYYTHRASPNDGTSYAGANSGSGFWLKLSRRSNLFTAYTSSDGVSWTAVPNSAQTIPMGITIYAGLAVSSGDSSALRRATLDSVSVTNP
jgi:hypothetical protein